MNTLEETVVNVLYDVSRQFKPAVLPSDIDRGRLGDCFDHCLIQALKSDKYDYVEGFATDPNNPEGDMLLHAWLTDGVHAFDPTWIATDDNGIERPFPSIYMGLVIDKKIVARWVMQTKYKCFLANRDLNPHSWDIIMDGVLEYNRKQGMGNTCDTGGNC